MEEEPRSPDRPQTKGSRPSPNGGLRPKSLAIPFVVLALVALSVVGVAYLLRPPGPGNHHGQDPVPGSSTHDSSGISEPASSSTRPSPATLNPSVIPLGGL